MKKSVNFVIKESITEALLRLMAKKNFVDISITEITKLAGVSRISFYRNYASKEDVLIKYMHGRAMSLFDSFGVTSNSEKLIGMFRATEGIKDIIDLIYSQNLSYIFLQYFLFAIGSKPEQTNHEAYRNSIVVGICFGVLDEWIKRGRQESPEDMLKVIQTTLQDFFD
ncbi:TetR/AcrR family transcriptional regulator [Pasteurellaceae bacterium LIM206]|nr:TetR/AcrR family transcriptional regulator [Pasteurellaceae bacterium LIM206]